MYQSCWYDYNEYKYYLRDDKNGWSSFNYQPTLYVKDPYGEFTALDGETVSPVKKPKDWKDPKYYEKDIEKVTRLLVDVYHDSDDLPSYHNLVYLDIECEIFGALTAENIKEAPSKITAIALHDGNNKTYFCFVLDEKNQLQEIKEGNKIVIPAKTEKELLELFLNKWEQLDPTIITTWNGGFFDIPYLFNRIKNQLGESQALRLSPIGKVREQPFDFEQPLKIGGVNHLDYLLLFKKYVTKQESSYKLNDIGKKYVDLSKVEYEGSLEKLFNEDKNKFIEYNLRDVEIIVALEEKLKYINLTTIICHLCHTEYEQIYYATAINEGRILTYLKRKGIISPNKPTTYNPELKNRTNEEKDYAGGFLLDPKIGLHHYLFDCDASSLYPTIMMSLNMSPETLIGRIVIEGKYDCWWSLQELKEKDQEEEITLESKEGKLKNIKIKELIEFIEENQLSISANGVLFRTDIKGVLPEVLEDGFTRRQELKKQMKDAGKKKDWNRYKLYEQRQHSFKILINSLYGAMSLPSFRFTDGKLFISSAITLTGQRLIQESIRFINSKIKEDIK